MIIMMVITIDNALCVYPHTQSITYHHYYIYYHYDYHDYYVYYYYYYYYYYFY